MNKLVIAFNCFFKILFNRIFYENVKNLIMSDKAKELEDRGDKEQFKATRILTILQRDARFIDFLKENLDTATDEQIGAVARNIHKDCKKALDSYLTIEEVIKKEEGSNITVEKGFDPSVISLTGNVSGDPPFCGTLRHHGWKVKEIKLAPLPKSIDQSIIQPAEVEL